MKKEYLKHMKPGSVIVDVAVDQGGCCETTTVTYHDDPTFVVVGVVHYCVGNMPGAVPYTSTIALTNATPVSYTHLSNVCSMVTFLLGGHILLLLGLTASVLSIAGHYVGAGMVLKNGTKVIRPIILVVLALLFIKIIFNL